MNAVALTTADHSTEIVGTAGLTVEALTSVAALEAAAADWRALEALSAPSAVFQSHAHLLAWARHFVDAAGGQQLALFLVRRAGRPVLALPLVVGGLPGLRIARLAGDPVAQYSDILADPGADCAAAFETALAAASEAGVDAIVLRRVRADSELMRLARPRLRPPTEPRVAPYADLSGFTDFAGYLGALPRKTRQGLRNRRNRLAKTEGVVLALLRGGAVAREAVATAIEMKRVWLVQRGEVSTAFVDPATKACLLDLAEDPASGSAVALMTVNGEIAGVRLGFEYRGTHFAYFSTYDEHFAELAPGRMLMDFCLSGFAERGFTRLDMLPPAGRHKAEWCDQEMPVADYTLPLTPAGRLYAALYQERFRPFVHLAWQHTPTSLRSLISALVLRL